MSAPVRPERVRRILRPVLADRGPCYYCGNMYTDRTASVHFIPCCYCQDLTHPGCKH